MTPSWLLFRGIKWWLVSAVLLFALNELALDPVLPIPTIGFMALFIASAQVWTDLRRSAQNTVQPNFGCAVTANVAAQIADPSDLLGPRPTDPSDAGRRAVVLDKYRKGQRTGAATDNRADGAVSNAVQ